MSSSAHAQAGSCTLPCYHRIYEPLPSATQPGKHGSLRPSPPASRRASSLLSRRPHARRRAQAAHGQGGGSRGRRPPPVVRLVAAHGARAPVGAPTQLRAFVRARVLAAAGDQIAGRKRVSSVRDKIIKQELRSSGRPRAGGSACCSRRRGRPGGTSRLVARHKFGSRTTSRCRSSHDEASTSRSATRCRRARRRPRWPPRPHLMKARSPARTRPSPGHCRRCRACPLFVPYGAVPAALRRLGGRNRFVVVLAR